LKGKALMANRANRLTLVVSSDGIPFRRVSVPGVVWR
jgi:hypothetical protein